MPLGHSAERLGAPGRHARRVVRRFTTVALVLLIAAVGEADAHARRPHAGRAHARHGAEATAAARAVPRRDGRDRPPMLAFTADFVRGRTKAQLVASYRRLRAMGVQVIRLDFRWAALERIGRPLHRYVWSNEDREVRAIRGAGLKILAILDYGNPNYSRAGWAAYARGQRPSGPFGVGDPQYYPPDDPRTFAGFAAAVAHRYRADVMGWEIWNEENEGWRFWEPKENPQAYGRLLCAAHGTLERLDAGVPVVLGGLFFPSLGGAVGTGAVGFLTDMLRSPWVRGCFDAVAYHPYPYPFTSPEAVVNGRGSVVGASGQLRAVLRQFGLGRTPLWNTEVGWPTDPLANGVTEAEQARYVTRLELLSWARGVPLVTCYTWGDTPDPGGQNQEAHFGFFRVNGTAKPVYRALTTLQRVLRGRGWQFVADRSRALHLPSGRRGVRAGFALEFSGPGSRRVLALWYANEQPPASSDPFAAVQPGTPSQHITVRLSLRHPVVLVTMDGRRRVLPRSHHGTTRLPVGQDPVYVSWRR